MKKLLAAVACSMLVASCGSSSPASPSSASVSGTWSGTVVSNYSGPSTLRLTLTQSGNALSGTWSTNSNAGQVSGSKNSSSVSVTATPSDPRTCPFTANLTLSSATAMTGTYAAFNCTVSDGGSVNVTKQ